MDKYYVINDICVVCGEYAPEGEMLCPVCRKLAEQGRSSDMPPEGLSGNKKKHTAFRLFRKKVGM